MVRETSPSLSCVDITATHFTASASASITGHILPALAPCHICGFQGEVRSLRIVGDTRCLLRLCGVCKDTMERMGLTPSEFVLQQAALLDDARRRADAFAESERQREREGESEDDTDWPFDPNDPATLALGRFLTRVGLLALCLAPAFLACICLPAAFGLRTPVITALFLLGLVGAIPVIALYGGRKEHRHSGAVSEERTQ